jgi:hypothetical protein
LFLPVNPLQSHHLISIFSRGVLLVVVDDLLEVCYIELRLPLGLQLFRLVQIANVCFVHILFYHLGFGLAFIAVLLQKIVQLLLIVVAKCLSVHNDLTAQFVIDFIVQIVFIRQPSKFLLAGVELVSGLDTSALISPGILILVNTLALKYLIFGFVVFQLVVVTEVDFLEVIHPFVFLSLFLKGVDVWSLCQIHVQIRAPHCLLIRTLDFFELFNSLLIFDHNRAIVQVIFEFLSFFRRVINSLLRQFRFNLDLEWIALSIRS